MPIYEYTCGKCGKLFEELVFSEAEEPSCPECGARGCKRLVSVSFGSASSKGGTGMPRDFGSSSCGGGGGYK
jgi:putative FmdB family regulatory protein